ncbi:hypothetical protein HHK36_005743 [Tetracentron sinense]|uniref:SnoaL-like domain-containing protein n=1 Tax=Tetracentron sinense TaxID=13715 RepID=A0A834ZL41_TETSI|nr:hypothetical protein HHK36_005743 [Tetracentron sinense]
MFSTCSMKTQLNFPIVSRARDAHHPSLNLIKPIHKNFLQIAHASFDFHSPLSNQILIERGFSSRNAGFSLVPFGTKSSGSGEEDGRALETVLGLYNAINERNIRKLSDVIGEECSGVSNFISFIQHFHGKKQVLGFFSSLMRNMGKHIEFSVQSTLQDGMNVCVSWKLEWEKTHVPLGKGFSFYVCHMYQGKVVIRNMEMIMEPLLNIEPLRLKIMGFVMSVLVDKTGPHFLITVSFPHCLVSTIDVELSNTLWACKRI